MSDVRRSLRVAYDRAVRVRCDTWDDFQHLYATNLSRGGVFLATERPAPVLTPVHLQIVLPDNRSLVLRGRVAHVVPPARAASDGRTAGMGVELVDADGESARAIEMLVREIKAAQEIAALRPRTRPPRPSPPPPGRAPEPDDPPSLFHAYLADLKRRSPYGVLGAAPGAGDAQILAQYEALSAQFAPARFAMCPPDVRAAVAEIAMALRRAFDTLVARPSGAHPRMAPPRARRATPPPVPVDALPPQARAGGRLDAGGLFAGLEFSQDEVASPPLTGESVRVERAPGDWHRAGVALLRAQRYRDARDMLKRAVDGDAGNTLYERDHAIASALELRTGGQFEEAAEMLVRALAIDSACREAAAELRALLDQRKVRRTSAIVRALGGG